MSSIQRRISCIVSPSPRWTSRRHAQPIRRSPARPLVTLAIESSCDDTSIAILEKCTSKNPPLVLHFHHKVTSDNRHFNGVHPIASLESHQENLALLLSKAIHSLPLAHAPGNQSPIYVNGTPRILDFVAVTRGPGMRSNLSVGLDAAKGMAAAWQRPLVAVNHMQAHALTPRLVHGLGQSSTRPEFPFLSLLVSGGHTMLIHSTSLCAHSLLATSCDIALGDFIDKVARDVLPPQVLQSSKSTMYGPVLEAFAFLNGDSDYQYSPPVRRSDEVNLRPTRYGWGIRPPMPLSADGVSNEAMAFTFSGMGTRIKDIAAEKPEMGLNERRELAKEAHRLAFEHLASRVTTGLAQLAAQKPDEAAKVKTLVVSGGVAANKFLKHVLRAYLDAKGHHAVQLVFPPLELCTDNAAMIAWAGMEMFEAGWQSLLSCKPLRKWSLDPAATDGGILGVAGWEQRQQ